MFILSAHNDRVTPHRLQTGFDLAWKHARRIQRFTGALPPRYYAPLPVPGLPVEVQCDGFKCMAFRNSSGKWIDLFSREFLTRVLGVVPAAR